MKTSSIISSSLVFLLFAAVGLPFESAEAQRKSRPRVICKNSRDRLVVRRNCRGPELERVNSQSIAGEQGPQGATGPQGPQGDEGPAGPGVATGGTTGQILAKASDDNFDTQWINPSSGSDLFSFTGSTLDQDLQVAVYNLNGINQSVGLADTHLAALPVLSSCSEMEYLIEVSEAPGPDPARRQFSISVTDYSGFIQNAAFAFCILTENQTSCNGTVALTGVTAGSSIALFSQAFNAPAAARGRWVIRCTQA